MRLSKVPRLPPVTQAVCGWNHTLALSSKSVNKRVHRVFSLCILVIYSTVTVLLHYCGGTVEVLWRYCRSTVEVLSKYCGGTFEVIINVRVSHFFIESGEVYVWGSNSFGQLGMPEGLSVVDTPQLLEKKVRDLCWLCSFVLTTKPSLQSCLLPFLLCIN